MSFAGRFILFLLCWVASLINLDSTRLEMNEPNVEHYLEVEQPPSEIHAKQKTLVSAHLAWSRHFSRHLFFFTRAIGLYNVIIWPQLLSDSHRSVLSESDEWKKSSTDDEPRLLLCFGRETRRRLGDVPLPVMQSNAISCCTLCFNGEWHCEALALTLDIVREQNFEKHETGEEVYASVV